VKRELQEIAELHKKAREAAAKSSNVSSQRYLSGSTCAYLEEFGLKIWGRTAAPFHSRDFDGIQVIEVELESEADAKGVRLLDIIDYVNERTVHSPNDFIRGINKAREIGLQAVQIRVRSGKEKSRSLALALKHP
jgi:S1-C subfamily serine protease